MMHDTYGWYSLDRERFLATGVRYHSLESAQIAVNLAYLDGAMGEDGVDWDGDCCVLSADPTDRVKPAPVTNAQLQAMIGWALENWLFDDEVDERYAEVDVQLRRMQGAEVDPIEINANVASPDDWDGLMEWAADLAAKE